ncbi:MAG: conjugal transfer protein TraF [Ignavibacteriaceae bacterium]
MKGILICFLFCVLHLIPLKAQGGYEIDPEVKKLEDIDLTFESTPLYIPDEKEDVKSIGMGKTQVANGRTFNAMMSNPAFLGNKKFSLEALSVQASLPPETFAAANYLNSNTDEFKQALSLKAVWEAVKEFKAANNIQDQLLALQRIQDGLRFPRNLLDKVIGSSQSPITHGLKILPGISLQTQNFGFSLYAVGQSGFIVQQNPVVDLLLDIHIPNDLNNPQEVQNAINSLEGLLKTIVNASDDISQEALPVTYSVSYIDIVGAAGYGFKITPHFNVGANLKIINRRFSAKRIVTQDFNDILNILKKDFDANKTGFTMDIGALYDFDFGLRAGISVQNIIPFQTLTSTLNAEVTQSGYDYKRDQNGNIIINNNGDTVLQAVTRNVNLFLPFDLKLPLLVNLGATFSIDKNWDVSFELADAAEQDTRYISYENRIRLGSEYRLETSNNFGVSFRLGLADNRITGGLGFNIFRILQIDGAYAFDSYVQAYSYYGQVRLGW